jgi:hypothetical protein
MTSLHFLEVMIIAFGRNGQRIATAEELQHAVPRLEFVLQSLPALPLAPRFIPCSS